MQRRSDRHEQQQSLECWLALKQPKGEKQQRTKDHNSVGDRLEVNAAPIPARGCLAHPIVFELAASILGALGEVHVEVRKVVLQRPPEVAGFPSAPERHVEHRGVAAFGDVGREDCSGAFEAQDEPQGQEAQKDACPQGLQLGVVRLGSRRQEAECHDQAHKGPQKVGEDQAVAEAGTEEQARTPLSGAARALPVNPSCD